MAVNLRTLGELVDDDEYEHNTDPVTIEMKNLRFSYRGSAPTLNGIDLIIDKPGLYCIVGPNGVGKSTLVKCICKIHDFTDGDILIDGRSVKDMHHKDVAKVIGYVPAFTGDVFSMTVVDALMVGCYNRRRWNSEESDLGAVYSVMKLMRIEDLSHKRMNELSAGQLQRVAIARGLVQRPKVLVLDEPTANLDVRYQVYLTELLRAVAECCNIAVIMISHDLNISAKYGHEIIMMAPPGIIHMVGEPAEVITQENVETIYGVHCRIIRDEEFDSPLVILGRSHLGEGERPA